MERDKIIHNMCFTWRHDYGLLDEKEKTFLFNQMKQVFENNIENELVTQGDLTNVIKEDDKPISKDHQNSQTERNNKAFYDGYKVEVHE